MSSVVNRTPLLVISCCYKFTGHGGTSFAFRAITYRTLEKCKVSTDPCNLDVLCRSKGSLGSQKETTSCLSNKINECNQGSRCSDMLEASKVEQHSSGSFLCKPQRATMYT
jgi:hypothetical protein